MKVKIPIDKNKQTIIYTKNIVSTTEVDRLMEFMHAVDWTKKWLMLPSEYVEKVEFVQIKMEKIKKLREAMRMIWEVDRELREKGIDSMLGYCEDYINIAIDEIENAKNT